MGDINRADVEAKSAPDPPRRTGRWVALVPADSQYNDFLYQMAVDEESGYRWRLAGSVPPREVFQRDLWNGVLCQFVIVERQAGAPVGTVICYNADLHHGVGFVAGAVVTAVRESGLGVEGFDLFFNYLFRTYDLRKIYLEIPEYNVAQMGIVGSSLFCEEGRLRSHTYYDGRHWDRFVVALYRDDYLSQSVGGMRARLLAAK